MLYSPSRQLSNAVKQGALDDVHRLLDAGVNPNAVKQVKCLLVTALKHPDPICATEMANALLAAGMGWKGRSKTSPLGLIRQRRVLGVLPSLAKIPRVTRAPIQGTDGFFLAGLFALDGWSEGLRVLANLGVDIRHGMDERTYAKKTSRPKPKNGILRYWMSPVKKFKTSNEQRQRLGVISTLRVWLARVPQDQEDRGVDSDWVKTALWLMETAPEHGRRDAEQIGLANEIAGLSCLDMWDGAQSAFSVLEEAWMQSELWWSDEAGRQAVCWHASYHLMRPHGESAKWRRIGWSRARAIVERKKLALDSSHDPHSSSSALLYALFGCQKMGPRRLKQSLEQVRWALEHGASYSETSVWYGVFMPVWLEGFQRPGVPWKALKPLMEAGWDPKSLALVSTYSYSEERWIDNHLPLPHALKHMNMVGLEQYLQEFPQEVHRLDANHQTFLQHSIREAFTNRSVCHEAKPLVDTFLVFGGDVENRDIEGEHVLHALLSNEHNPFNDLDETLLLIWERAPALFDVRNAQGLTCWQMLEGEKLQSSRVAQSLLKRHALGEALGSSPLHHHRTRF